MLFIVIFCVFNMVFLFEHDLKLYLIVTVIEHLKTIENTRTNLFISSCSISNIYQIYISVCVYIYILVYIYIYVILFMHMCVFGHLNKKGNIVGASVPTLKNVIINLEVIIFIQNKFTTFHVLTYQVCFSE